MDYRQLGRSGLRVSPLTMGTMTFGGRGFFANVGIVDLAAQTAKALHDQANAFRELSRSLAFADA